jgi:hypothetical protein
MLGQQAPPRFHYEIESPLRTLLRQSRELDAPQAGRRLNRKQHRRFGATHIHAEINFTGS